MLNVKTCCRPFCIAITLSLLIGLATLAIRNEAYAQSTDDELKQAQIEYYKEQTEKLKKKSFVDTVLENPAGVMTVLGAMIAALVALASLIVNSRVTMRTQRDTQFYEALKRFGDKDSPILRSSAAGLLAQMAGERHGLFRRRRYFETTIDQLVTGLLLETHSVALLSISMGIQHLIPSKRRRIAEKLLIVNQKIKGDLQDKLIEWCVNSGIKRLEDITVERVNRLEAISKAGAAMIRDWSIWLSDANSANRDELSKQFSTYFQAVKAASMEIGGEHLIAAQRDLLEISDRLTRVNELLGRCLIDNLEPTSNRFYNWLKKNVSIGRFMAKETELRGLFSPGWQLSFTELSRINLLLASLPTAMFSGAILNKVRLDYARLHESDFRKASLKKVTLTHAHLTGARFLFSKLDNVDFYEADLRGADFTNTTFREVRFTYADFDADTYRSLENTNWWACEYYYRVPFRTMVVIENEKLDELFSLYKDKLPSNPRSLHKSVRAYLESKKTSD